MGKLYGGISLETYALSAKTGRYQDRKSNGTLGRNQMLWDFGLNPFFFDNMTAVDEKLNEIDSTFDLVLLTERFDESMILLKDSLCWDYKDITSIKLNAHDTSTKSKVSKKAREALKSWLKGDYVIYDHFRKKFQEHVENFGLDKMEHELEILRHANSEMAKQCEIKQVSNEELNPDDKLYGSGVLGYKMNTDNKECVFMGMKEVKFLNILRKLQTQRAEEISGMNFHDDFDPTKFVALGSHISLDQLKSMYRYKGP